MAATIGYREVVEMVRRAAAQVHANRDMLSKLDSFGGDGDHGTTMARAMDIAGNAIPAEPSEDLKALLKAIGWGIMGVDGGATGPLFGTFFMSMSAAAPDGSAVDASALTTMFEAGLEGVRKRTKAQVGDKTMLDALTPAVQAMRRAVNEGADVRDALARAAQAAAEGAEATKSLQARFGRAKNLGEKSIGSQDPGATSVSLLFQGFVEGVQTDA